VGSGCLKPVNSLQACPDADVNEEGWYLRLAFQTASGGILPVAAKGNFQVDVSLPHLVKGASGTRAGTRAPSISYWPTGVLHHTIQDFGSVLTSRESRRK